MRPVKPPEETAAERLAGAFGVPLGDVVEVYARHYPPKAVADLLPTSGDTRGTEYTRADGSTVWARSELADLDHEREPWAWTRARLQFSGDENDQCGCGCGQARVECFRCGHVVADGRYADNGGGKLRMMCHECADEADRRAESDD